MKVKSAPSPRWRETQIQSMTMTSTASAGVHVRSATAASVVQRRLMQPSEGVRIMNTVADLGKRKLYILAEANEEAVNNIQDTLELTTQPAIDSVETTLVVDGKRAINTYLTM